MGATLLHSINNENPGRIENPRRIMMRMFDENSVGNPEKISIEKPGKII